MPEGEPCSENALLTLFRWPRRGKKGCRRGGIYRRRVPVMRTEGFRCAFLARPFPRRTRGSASLPVEGARGRVALPRDHAGGKSPKGPKWVRPVAPAGRISGLCTGRTKSTLAYSRARRMVGRDVPAEPFLPVFQTSCPLPHRLAGDGSPHQGPCHPIKGHQKSRRKGGGGTNWRCARPAGGEGLEQIKKKCSRKSGRARLRPGLFFVLARGRDKARPSRNGYRISWTTLKAPGGRRSPSFASGSCEAPPPFREGGAAR